MKCKVIEKHFKIYGEFCYFTVNMYTTSTPTLNLLL